jgi:hypothetical protein
MKRSVLSSLAIAILSFTANAQAVSKRVVVEHFTNSYCSICASRNPGFYNNLWQFPQVLHVAIHPSAPYSACPINKFNKTDNDARTNFYGVYGSTPRLIIQGKVIPANADYNSASLFQNELNQLTPFDVNVSLTPISFADAQVRVVVKKVDASTLTNLQLFGAIVQDTFFFNANNGETKHYDVFRKAVWSSPMSITAPANVGDSIVYTQTVSLDQSLPKVYAMAILSDAANKEVVQAAKSTTIPVTTTVNTTSAAQVATSIYPNPTFDKLYVETVNNTASYIVTDIKGIIVARGNSVRNSIDVSALSKGVYILKLNSANNQEVLKFIKQ